MVNSAGKGSHWQATTLAALSDIHASEGQAKSLVTSR